MQKRKEKEEESKTIRNQLLQHKCVIKSITAFFFSTRSLYSILKRHLFFSPLAAPSSLIFFGFIADYSAFCEPIWNEREIIHIIDMCLASFIKYVVLVCHDRYNFSLFFSFSPRRRRLQSDVASFLCVINTIFAWFVVIIRRAVDCCYFFSIIFFLLNSFNNLMFAYVGCGYDFT